MSELKSERDLLAEILLALEQIQSTLEAISKTLDNIDNKTYDQR